MFISHDLSYINSNDARIGAWMGARMGARVGARMGARMGADLLTTRKWIFRPKRGVNICGINTKFYYPLMKVAMPYSKKSANRKCSSI